MNGPDQGEKNGSMRDRFLVAHGIGMKVSFLLVALLSISYFVYWTWVSISKYLSLYDHVFDLGIVAQRGWVILHSNLGLKGYLSTILNSGIVFPLSPLTGSGNYYAIIIFQVLVVTLTGVAFYRIARMRGLGLALSTLVPVVYFLYYPIYGIFWYDFHYQVMFLPLFVAGYMFYLEKRYKLALVLMILSGLVRYPYCIFPLGFAFIEIASMALKGHLRENRPQMTALFALFITMAIFTIGGYLYLNGIGSVQTIVLSSSRFYNFQGIDTRIFTVMLFLAPLLFLPLLSPRWLILALPSFYLILTSGNVAYTYPFILQGQYVAGIAPFLLLGFIEGLSSLQGHRESTRAQASETRPQKLKVNINSIKLIGAILVVIILLNVVYAPYGSLNNHSGDSFSLEEKTAYNATVVGELNYMVALIPSNSSYVAFQDNLPQVLPRPLPEGSVLLLAGYLGNILPFNLSNAVENKWPISLPNGSNGTVPINYAVADANNPNFYYQPSSMYDLLSVMYKSGQYGIVAEGAGLILLERGYSGTIMHYIPSNSHYKAQVFTNYSTGKSGYASISGTNDFTNSFLFYGPGAFLYPGNYTASFLLRTDSLNQNNSMWIQVTSGSGANLISFRQLGGTSFSSTGHWEEFDLNFTLNTVGGYIEFRGYGIQWSGTIWFGGVNLKQTAAFGHLQ